MVVIMFSAYQVWSCKGGGNWE